MPLKAYLRVSTALQAKSGLGLQAQTTAAQSYAKTLTAPWATECHNEKGLPGFFVDDGKSAYSLPLHKRPAGKALLASLQKDDILVVLRLDRLCRSMEDFCSLVKLFEQKGVSLVSLSPQINMTTANGRALAKLLIVVAEWESAIKSERIKGALAIKKLSETTNAVAKQEKFQLEPSDYRPVKKQGVGSGDPTGGTVYCYTRCSHRSSAKSGLGLREQLTACDAFAARLIEQRPELSLGDPYIDMAVSALSKPFASRPQGGSLASVLKKGDHVVIYRPDRAFGHMKDFFDTVTSWTERGITVHFAEDGSNTGDETGRMLIFIMTMFSQMEKELAATRNREAKEIQEASGIFRGGRSAPVFWKLYKNNGVKKLVLDRQQLVEYRYLQGVMRCYGLSQSAACERLEALRASKESRKPVPQSGVHISNRSFSGCLQFVRRQGNTLYPNWTRSKFVKAVDLFPAAMATWRKLVQERREHGSE